MILELGEYKIIQIPWKYPYRLFKLWKIKCRIGTAGAIFNKIRSFSSDDNLKLELRQQKNECYVWSLVRCKNVKSKNNEFSWGAWDVVTSNDVPYTMGTNTFYLMPTKAISDHQISNLGQWFRGMKYHLLRV